MAFAALLALAALLAAATSGTVVATTLAAVPIARMQAAVAVAVDLGVDGGRHLHHGRLDDDAAGELLHRRRCRLGVGLAAVGHPNRTGVLGEDVGERPDD